MQPISVDCTGISPRDLEVVVELVTNILEIRQLARMSSLRLREQEMDGVSNIHFTIAIADDLVLVVCSDVCARRVEKRLLRKQFIHLRLRERSCKNVLLEVAHVVSVRCFLAGWHLSIPFLVIDSGL